MCGFGGYFNHFDNFNLNEINNIASLVNHRGPDSSKVINLDKDKSGKNINNMMFFNRLAIIDLEKRSDQPFSDGRYFLVFNGEIYNYRQIKLKLLKDFNINFFTESDTEVLFNLLKYHKEDGIKELNGMFSFVFYDSLEERCIISRDRFGIKPLYYKFYNSNTFIFSSELKSIVRLLKNDVEINIDSIKAYSSINYIPTPQTPFKEIHKLEPGHYIVFSNNFKKYKKNKFYDSYQTNSNSKSQNTTILDLLKKSVISQFNADVTVGFFLSSGIDSSLLVALADKIIDPKNNLNVFTIGIPEDKSYDESDNAKDFISKLSSNRIKHTVINLKEKNIITALDSIYKYFDEPISDPAILLNYIISKEARKHTTVVLSGDGADEIFWGYERYNFDESKFVKFLKKIITFFKLNVFINQFNKINFYSNDFEKYINGVTNNFISNRVLFTNKFWFTKNISSIIKSPKLKSLIDIKSYLTDAMLYKVDRSSMASSLEIRVPYLDNHVAEFGINSKIHSLKTKKFPNKNLLKQELIKIAPWFEINRKKRGFSFPLAKWLKEDWRSYVLENFKYKNCPEIGLSYKYLNNLIEEFYLKNNNKLADEIWNRLNLILWYKSINNDY